MKDQVFLDPAHREEETWRVVFRDRLEPAHFQSKGAAAAHLDMLKSGYREPAPK